MNGNCHYIFSFSIGTMLALNMTAIESVFPNIVANDATATLLVIGTIFGGISPDMDNPKSFIAKISEPFSTIICKFGKRFGRGGKYHRGILHDPFLNIMGLILSYHFFPSLVSVFIGSISHLFLDLYNPVGLPLMFGRKYISISHIKSGSKNAIWFTYTNVIYVLAFGFLFKFGLLTPLSAF